MKWINVKNRLPNHNQTILIFYKGYYIPVSVNRPPRHLSQIGMMLLPIPPYFGEEFAKHFPTCYEIGDFDFWTPITKPLNDSKEEKANDQQTN